MNLKRIETLKEIRVAIQRELDRGAGDLAPARSANGESATVLNENQIASLESDGELVVAAIESKNPLPEADVVRLATRYTRVYPVTVLDDQSVVRGDGVITDHDGAYALAQQVAGRKGWRVVGDDGETILGMTGTRLAD
ncbi:hypothetical protein R1X32_42900 [Rhodococcus opacus]|uniref:hypothetical protein n=1 Tax=Rhodococcus opacus TaxID=37919 RepID=UPI0034D32AA5